LELSTAGFPAHHQIIVIALRQRLALVLSAVVVIVDIAYWSAADGVCSPNSGVDDRLWFIPPALWLTALIVCVALRPQRPGWLVTLLMILAPIFYLLAMGATINPCLV
jgi:hypothetical protein